jgi:hypothetical protein
MEKGFAPFQQALELKELGFDEPCLMYYDYLCTLVESGVYECKAPLYQQVFRWFREKHSLFHSIDPLGYNMCLGLVGQLGKLKPCNVPNYGTYEEAELECVKELITTIKNKK